MKRRLAVSFAIAMLAAVAPLQADIDETSPLDRLTAEYRPHLDLDDPLGFAMKIRAISIDEYRFWRGTKGLFYAWCRDHANDLTTGPRVPGHGDIHFGNVGTYTSTEGWPQLAVGLVDFDDACPLPVAIELLQVFITTRLVAEANGLVVDQNLLDRVTADAYRTAAASGKTATELLRNEPAIRALLSGVEQTDYTKELAKFCDADGRFRRVVGKPAKPSDVLSPIEEATDLDALATAIAEACNTDPNLASRMVDPSVAGLRAKLRGAAHRTRLGSSGSQGLDKILVRLERPFRDVETDVLLYLKQQIPAAAERSGLVPGSEFLTPARRASEMVTALTSPRPFANGTATFRGRSYLVMLKEPWSEELDADRLRSTDELFAASRAMATIVGAAHARGVAIAPPDDTLLVRIANRADAYVVTQRGWHEMLRKDPRTLAWIAKADAAVSAVNR